MCVCVCVLYIYVYMCVCVSLHIYIYIYNHRHHVMLLARTSLLPSCHPFLSSIASDRSSRPYHVSIQMCCR